MFVPYITSSILIYLFLTHWPCVSIGRDRRCKSFTLSKNHVIRVILKKSIAELQRTLASKDMSQLEN